MNFFVRARTLEQTVVQGLGERGLMGEGVWGVWCTSKNFHCPLLGHFSHGMVFTQQSKTSTRIFIKKNLWRRKCVRRVIFQTLEDSLLSTFTLFTRWPLGRRATCNAGCTLSPREPETRRERECRWEHSPCLGSSRVASALTSRLVKVSLF